MADASPIAEALQRLASAAAAVRHRRLVLLCGGVGWCSAQARVAIAALPGSWCWVGDEAGAGVTRIAVAQAHTLLGGEWDGLVYDSRAGLDPDALGALAGTLRAGGLLLLLTPPLDVWPDYPDPQRQRIAVHPYGEEAVGKRFLLRLARLLQETPLAYRIEEGSPLAALPDPTPPAPVGGSGLSDGCATLDQEGAVEALCRVVLGHRRRPLVLVSDRGRGKSTALGIAAARLLRQGVRRIVVTAPRLSAVAQLFHHAASLMPEAAAGSGEVRLPDGAGLYFAPPDRVVHEELPCDLLLVDEAAAIPTALLEVMLRKHARIAFATTVHGYEGTGRGFDLRFRRTLDEVTPEWRRLRLEEPIRWAAGDPLERLVFRALLLDAEPLDDEAARTIPVEECRIERFDRDTLIGDEGLLGQLFGLLVLAHYRTSPGDLRNLLDGPNLEVHLLRADGQLLGCALVAREGVMEEGLAQRVYAGERRLRGNLLPQSLAVHAGIAEAPLLSAARVMRIAIHPARQGEGWGRRLIGQLAAHYAGEGVDYLGASFAADERLLDFWRGCDCLPVRVGMQRESASGAHTVMVLRPLSPRGEALSSQARRRLAQQLLTQLSEPLAALEPGLVGRLFEALDIAAPEAAAWEDVRSFACLRRDYGNCLAALREVLGYHLSRQPTALSPAQRTLAIAKVLQLHPWTVVVRQCGFSGRREGELQLRELFRHICSRHECVEECADGA